MKIRKIIGILFCILIYQMSFSGISIIEDKNIKTKLVRIDTNPQSIIIGKTTNVSVTIEAEVTSSFYSDDLLIYLKDWKFNNSSFYFTLSDITNAGDGGRFDVYFDKNNTVNLKVSGTLVIDWDKMNTNPILKIGEVRNGKGNGSQYYGDVLINLKEVLNFVSSLKIRVLKHMDFGTVIAGQSKEAKTPAEIVVEGVRGSEVKIEIPTSTIIRNEKGNEIKVNLYFKENSTTNGTKSVITKNIDVVVNEDISRTEPVIINGNLITKKDDSGLYTGTFTVRAEYEN